MLARSAVRKAAAGQRPALRALDNRTRRPGQRQQFRARPRIRRLRRAERQAGRRAVPEPASWAWLSSGAVSGTVTYPITGSLPVMAQRSSPPRLAPLRVTQWLPPIPAPARPGRWSAAGHTMTPRRTPGSGPGSISRAMMPRGSSESWIRCSTPSSRTAAGCPKSSASAARCRQNHPGITQVCLEVIGPALRGALEQRLCVQGFLSRR